ncbi:MAG: lytic transglycosylase domain-containing protein [Alphaproteobacteria bacterium]|jgi:soluble lytic murein transglycosylase-like protein|uniref:Membrane-bound lytic murein transglycosylase F n=1 Tax=Brevundimonas mediterranea TaxID=74329 RepID=A0A7Z8Y366_9CAUL|nr:lytic transglycosylase domain-containing protein [Brevundimonas mediterranea]MBU2031165.1 lytic transglycosylase domain-containing protein [Alphaproteobacteria bacterium]TAJ40637.1 MAG: lytic transglycosylase domain-containing protein [Brevundimonas sp.]MBU2163930.1 lytic transglycosylase domain-containing protein [Alphaproteobacteria bacterium]MBU2230372.1 lytic transglycosylase domain-containing protein [Alphaproteobacteria bacterium]VDC50091.1 Membrane-bound lytic murein transglycosylase
MVRSLFVGLAALAIASQVSAQAVDWRQAGGDLFGAPVAPVVEPASIDAGTPTLEPLSQPFQDAIEAAALAHGLDPKLLHALVVTESGYRADALSPAGAGGLTQLMPRTALDLGVRNRFDPIENLRGGAAYLARQLVRFGDLRLALAAYNAGPSRVERLGRMPDIAETRAYVSTVIECYLALSAGRSVRRSKQCLPVGDAP